VLLSDGEDYGSELVKQVNAFRQAQFHLNTIGIGSDTEVIVPIVQPDGKEAPLRDEEGRIVKTKFEEGTLRQLASETGGRYIRSRTGGDLAKALQEIEAGERRTVGYRTTTEYKDLYPAALAVAASAAGALWLLL
jgi:hypothetical protein